jgi:hypothetical protein
MRRSQSRISHFMGCFFARTKASTSSSLLASIHSLELMLPSSSSQWTRYSVMICPPEAKLYRSGCRAVDTTFDSSL